MLFLDATKLKDMTTDIKSHHSRYHHRHCHCYRHCHYLSIFTQHFLNLVLLLTRLTDFVTLSCPNSGSMELFLDTRDQELQALIKLTTLNLIVPVE